MLIFLPREQNESYNETTNNRKRPMSLQTVDGVEVYVVDLNTIPELPITWNTPDEEPYAKALEQAIRNGTISEPGKYGIHVHHFDPSADLAIKYSVAKIVE